MFADVIDGADVGMVEGGGGTRLASETFERLRVLRYIVGQELQGDETTEFACPRLCRPHPYHRRRAFLQCGSEIWSGRSLARILRLRNRQVNERRGGGKEGRRVRAPPWWKGEKVSLALLSVIVSSQFGSGAVERWF